MVWGDQAYAYFPDNPSIRYPLSRPLYDWKLAGFPEPYLLVSPEQTDCELLYDDYKNFCKWNPDLTSGRLGYYYSQIYHRQKHCVDLRARHLVSCRKDQDPGHLGAIIKAQRLRDLAFQRYLTARDPQNLEEEINQTLGSFSVIDYDEGPQYDTTERLLSIPREVLLDHVKNSQCAREIFLDKLAGQHLSIDELSVRELVYLILTCGDFYDLFGDD